MCDNKIDTEFNIVLEHIGIRSSSSIVYISNIDSGRRTYESNNIIYKIVLYKYNITSKLRMQTLEGEYNILKALNGLNGIPQNAKLHRTNKAIILTYERLHGIPLSEVNINLLSFAIILWKFKDILINISKRGVCHNDIHLQNIIIGDSCNPYLIDFDQANRSSLANALTANFLGWNKLAPTYGSFLGLIKGRLYALLPTSFQQAYRKLRNNFRGRG